MSYTLTLKAKTFCHFLAKTLFCGIKYYFFAKTANFKIDNPILIAPNLIMRLNLNQKLKSERNDYNNQERVLPGSELKIKRLSKKEEEIYSV